MSKVAVGQLWTSPKSDIPIEIISLTIFGTAICKIISTGMRYEVDSKRLIENFELTSEVQS